ncbi:MAG: hypothetical protein U5L45_20860 [Saprospiraceae bacterium]|nr:hypothetical protein [Saprospiraceae bacterium]
MINCPNVKELSVEANKESFICLLPTNRACVAGGGFETRPPNVR